MAKQCNNKRIIYKLQAVGYNETVLE